VFAKYFSEFGQSLTGTDEWYAPLFGGCVAGEYITNGHMGTRSIAPLYRALIEECLVGVADVSSKFGITPCRQVATSIVNIKQQPKE
jgi:hypothetical protein